MQKLSLIFIFYAIAVVLFVVANEPQQVVAKAKESITVELPGYDKILGNFEILDTDSYDWRLDSDGYLEFINRGEIVLQKNDSVALFTATHANTKELSILAGFPRLCALQLRNNILNEDDLKILKDWKYLRRLEISQLPDKDEYSFGITDAISKLNQLEILNISTKNIHGDVLMPLKGMRKLKELRIERRVTNTSVPDNPVNMKFLSSLSSLRLLALYNCNPAWEGEIPDFSKLKKLESITLIGVDDPGLWPAIAKLRSLKSLILYDCRPPEKGQLEKALNGKKLEYFQVTNTTLSKVADEVRASLKAESIHIYDWKLEDETFYKLITNNPKVKTLALSCSVNTETLKAIGKLKNLESLALGTDLDDKNDWTQLETLKKLKHITLPDSRLSPELSAVLSNLTKLETISIGKQPSHPDEVLTILNNFAKLKNLQKLDIEVLITSDAQLEIISHYESLRTLVVKDAQEITGEGFKYIGKMKELTRLELRNSDRAGIEEIRYLASLDKLKTLQINEFENFDAECLAELANINLQALFLLDCPKVDDKCLRNISSYRLRNIELTGCDSITDEGAKHLGKMKSLRTAIFGKKTFSSEVREQLIEDLSNTIFKDYKDEHRK